jgi:DNA-binding transcriptional regulator LsrR (DeoR family)
VSLSMQQQQQVEWRRAKILELMSKGETNQSEIARILQVDRSTICRDVDYLMNQAKENITRYIGERLPEEYEKCLVGLNSILKEAWTISQTENIKGDKIKALALAKECYAMKLELLTNATVVDDAIRFVALHAAPKEKTNSDKTADDEEAHSSKEQQSIAPTNTVF